MWERREMGAPQKLLCPSFSAHQISFDIGLEPQQRRRRRRLQQRRRRRRRWERFSLLNLSTPFFWQAAIYPISSALGNWNTTTPFSVVSCNTM